MMYREGIDGGHLHAFVQRYEHLQEEIDALNEDRSRLMKEVESAGFDKKVLKIVIKRRRIGKDQCDEEDTLVELYERALNEPPPRRPRASTRETAETTLVAPPPAPPPTALTP